MLKKKEHRDAKVNTAETSDAVVPRPRRLRLHEHGTHNDISYRGPLSYRVFQIVGWLCLVLSQAYILTMMASKANPSTAQRFLDIAHELDYVGAMALPFLLLASFATMLNHNTSYLMQLLKNFGLMMALAAAFYLGIYHYVLGALTTLDPDSNRAWKFVEALLQSQGAGFIKFNVFVDLFLCTLFLFFLCYRPRRFFQGKWVILLRICAILPVAYEIGCMALKWYSAKGAYQIPVQAFPFLTVKPPMTFMVFITLAIYVKVQERAFLKNGKTYEEYQAYLDTNRNSLHFSLVAAVALLLAGVLDYVIAFYIAVVETMQSGGLRFLTPNRIMGFQAMGFGDAIQLLVLAPIVLLFSYTRTHKNKLIDIFIPIVGIALIIIIYLQGSFQILKVMPLPKINLDEVTRTIQDFQSLIQAL